MTTQLNKKDPGPQAADSGSRGGTSVPPEYHKSNQSASPTEWIRDGKPINPDELYPVEIPAAPKAKHLTLPKGAVYDGQPMTGEELAETVIDIFYPDETPAIPEPEAQPPSDEDAPRADEPEQNQPLADPEGLYNLDAEQALLGAVLVDGKQFNECEQLTPTAFHDRRHWLIWQAFLDLKASGVAIDYTTSFDMLARMGKLEEAGNGSYLTSLLTAAPTSQNAASYAKIVGDYDARRRAHDRNLREANDNEKQILDLSKPFGESKVQQLVRDIEEYSTWADLNAGSMTFVWDKWLVSGLLNLLVSYSGDGKSYLALRICGCFVKGMPWPDGTPFTGETGKVLWVECEAAQALNLDRANTFGYSLDSIITPFDDPYRDANLDDPEERAIIDTRAALPEVKFIVVDSLSGGSRRKENDTGIKDVCLWLAQLTRTVNKPVMLIHHLGKKKEWDTGVITLERVRGSSAIVQFARIVWALSCPDVTNRETKRLEQIKNNLAKFPEAIGMTANDTGIDFGIAPEIPHVDTVGDQCSDLLNDLLYREPMKEIDIETELNGAGISLATAKRAKKKLGIVSIKKGNVWYWSLPAKQGDQVL